MNNTGCFLLMRPVKGDTNEAMVCAPGPLPGTFPVSRGKENSGVVMVPDKDQDTIKNPVGSGENITRIDSSVHGGTMENGTPGVRLS